MTNETMAEKLDAFREERMQLKLEISGLTREVKRLETSLKWKAARHWTVSFLVAAGILIGLGWLTWKGIHSYDTNDCYIKRSQSTVEIFMVNRRVEWWPDREIGYSIDLDKAMEIARKQGCRAPRLPEATP